MIRNPFLILALLCGFASGQTSTFKPAGSKGENVEPSSFKSKLSLSNVNDTSDANKPISIAQAAGFAAKQDSLVSGANIKSLNGVSLLGSGTFHTSKVLVANSVVTLDATGATDETADIQTAIAAAVAGNYKELTFLPGVYRGNHTMTKAQCEIKITGAGAGSTGDWTAVEEQGATMFIPHNDALPVWKFEVIRGVFMEDLEIRGNGAGTSVCGVLIDNPASYFAGNGFYATNVTIRRFTDAFKSMGGCNVHISKSGLFNSNRCVYVPKLETGLAHSYTFDQCSIGGVSSGVGSGGGSGDGRILQVEDGSFITLINCEMGNCTDMIYMGGSGTTSAIVNVINGNMETMSASVLNTQTGGNFSMTGTRIGTGNKTVLRVIGGTGEIIGYCIQDCQAQGPMTIADHHGARWGRVAGNGLNKTITEYTDNTFTTVRGSSVCERLNFVGRLTADQVIPASSTTTIVMNVEDIDVGSKHNTTTGEHTPGKASVYSVSANLRMSGTSTNAILGVYVNGSIRRTLGQGVVAGGVAMVSGSADLYVAAGDVITVRLATGGGGCTVQAMDNFSSIISITEKPYW